MMFNKTKRLLYFPLAYYFYLFAKIVLNRWKPRIVVVTGSSGKTTLLHLLASQLGDKAMYSFHANSSFGIPFNILGIERKTLSFLEWPYIFITTPLRIFRSLPKNNIYVVEVDCDRPKEGMFLSKLLKPEVTLWVSLGRTHSMNFESLVRHNRFNSLEDAISHEFGYLIENTKNLVVLNSDSKYIMNQSSRTNAQLLKVSLNNLDYKYTIERGRTHFKIRNISHYFNYLLPLETLYGIEMSKSVMKYFGLKFDNSFSKFDLPAGRSSLFKGVKNTYLVDSTYNANLDSMKVILKMFIELKTTNHKWIVLGDMLEQGNNEAKEHKLLAQEINNLKFDKIILMGPRISKYTQPYLKSSAVSFINPNEVLLYLKKEIKGGEIILFKGARFLEGVIENLLLNKSDPKKLVRREKVWDEKRKKFGL
ncbi:MAG: cyanophycin synthetase [bacterium]|nr:MAG: cyanophycin synthetase [bacterium]